MTDEQSFLALQTVAQAQRFTSKYARPRNSDRSRLIKRIQAFLDTKGQSTRQMRLNVASVVVGRQIDTFNELYDGEVQAMLQEENLEGIMEWLITPKQDDNGL